MVRDDVAYLVRENPEAHGIFDTATETRVMVYCQVESVGRAEFYRAQANGLLPRYVLKLSEYADYAGEKIVIYEGRRYRVLRSYVTAQAVELTIGEATVDADKTGNGA